MTRDELLTELAYYTQVLHEATEHETELDNRYRHLGHLAMAALMFKILHLRQPVSTLEQIYRIESKAYSFVKLPGPSATSALEPVMNFCSEICRGLPRLPQYLVR